MKMFRGGKMFKYNNCLLSSYIPSKMNRISYNFGVWSGWENTWHDEEEIVIPVTSYIK